MLLISVEVVGEPDFWPYQIDVDALPVKGMPAEIDDRLFVVDKVTLKSTERNERRHTYYHATLRPRQEEGTDG